MNPNDGFLIMGARLEFWYALGGVCLLGAVAVLGQIAYALGGAV